MGSGLGHALYRHRWRVLAATVLCAVLAGWWGPKVFDELSNAGFNDPGSESARAAELARATVGSDDADVVVVYRSARWQVDDPAFERAVRTTLADLPLAGVASYWDSRDARFVGVDRHTTYVAVRVDGSTDDAKQRAYGELRGGFAAPGLTTSVGGPVALLDQVNTQVKADIARAETLAMAVLLVLLVLIFRNVAAAFLPVLVGGLVILAALVGLRVLGLFTEVSIFAVNVVTLLGLGLAIDYCLLVVSRFREELARGRAVPHAVTVTMATAGRTVLVSAVTVAVALSSLLFFPQVFLRSIGFGGIAAVLLAAALSLTVLPALLGVCGHRLAARPYRQLFSRRPAPVTDRPAGDRFGRIARTVMRRPVLVATAAVAILVVLGLPFLRITYGWVDARVLPARAEARQAQEILTREFPGNVSDPIEVIVRSGQSTGSYVDSLRAVDGVRGAEVTARAAGTTRITVRFDGPAISPAARSLVDRIRAVPSPPGATVLVGGSSAAFADLLDVLGERLPWMALFVVVATLVLLFMAFGSVLLPIKAVLMNVVSLSAMYGVVVWIFQDGHLSGLLGFTPTGNIEVNEPILMLAVAFGLSMDYEVFLLSRIREQYDLLGDNTAAVSAGLQRTGGIITNAALLLIVVVGAFATSDVLFIKLIGVGMAVAIAIDATIVRLLLVPATMRMLGHANWWAPKALRPFHARYGIRENRSLEPVR